ncbi:MAG: VWA domain-containing protein, partial [Anaerolineae bacterium]|nr:VWA domain-containing protein [Anaerolineae bacterium]
MEAEYRLEHDVLSRTRDHRLYLLVQARAAESEPLTERQPLNLCVVLDRSSSMVGEKLKYVKDAASTLVQRLGASDRFSLVTYNENVHVVLAPSPVVHKDSMVQAIQSIRAMGTTNLSGGWLQGCSLLAEETEAGQVSRVLLLTDGLANQGVTDPDWLAEMAREKQAAGIVTTTMGVGLDFNEDLLTRMATEGGGAFYFIDSPDQAPQIFARELSDLLSVVGQNLVVTLTLERHVQLVRQLNAYPAQVTGEQVVFRLGDLYGDETKLLVLELAIPALYTLGPTRIVTLRFDYDDLADASAAHHTLDLPVIVDAVPDEAAPSGQPADPEVLKAALLLRAARARKEAVLYADAGDFSSAAQVLASVAEDIQGVELEDQELLAHHDMLREEVMDMELGAQRYDAYFRKSAATKSTYAGRTTHIDETIALHARLKSSRRAVERSGAPPNLLTWKRERRALEGIDRLTIGRSRDNDIVIPEDEVSSYHCRVFREGAALYLEDLGSTNGT